MATPKAEIPLFTIPKMVYSSVQSKAKITK
jgi:hypothetical protein